MSMMKRVIEDAEEYGIDWANRPTEEVLHDISLMKLGAATGYIDLETSVDPEVGFTTAVFTGSHFHNKNAPIDGRWDAVHRLGNRNQYNPGSASWRAYEAAFNASSAN